MESDTRRVVRIALRVALISVLIGLAISIPDRTWDATLANVVHSVCIGLAIFVFHAFPRGQQRQTWTMAARGARAALSISFGFVVGIVAAHLLLGQGLGWRTFADVGPFAAVVTAVSAVAFMYYFWSRERIADEAAASAEARRAAAEGHLKLLQTQIEPHMLFNTLANLRSLVEIDPPRAQTMIDELIVYLRATLSASRSTTVPLADEFAQLRAYLELMTVRMAHRLTYALALPDDLRDAAIPPMLLQPLVENAIRHGLEPKVTGGRITVTAERLDARLVVHVVDDGIGSVDAVPVPGYGLTHVRERLAALYGDAGRLTIEAPASGGMRMRVELPLAGSGVSR